MKNKEEAENFIRWVEINVFKSNDMDKLSFEEIAEIASKEFPTYDIDTDTVRTTTWAISRHKNKVVK